MSLLNKFVKVSISIESIEIVSHHIMTENIPMLQKLKIIAYVNLCLLSLTYHIRHEPRPLYANRLDELKEIDHSLSFQPLQLSMDANECTSTTNTITEVDEHVYVQSN